MKNYYRIALGAKNVHAEAAYMGNFVGVDCGIENDLTGRLPDNWKDFNREFIPLYLEKHPTKNKISAGLACGMLWTVTKFLQIGDRVLCPDGKGNYYFGEICGEYEYHKDEFLPHRRAVRWFPKIVSLDEMSELLQNSLKSFGTISNVSNYSDELENFISGETVDKTIEDLFAFALEKHLEDFLVKNWKSTELGRSYDIFEEDGEPIGQQYTSDTGQIDILAISKDKKELLVVELKKGRASDIVVGQILRYMGYVKDELAEPQQNVRGAIIAFEGDIRIIRALSVVTNIDFYTYTIIFKLDKRK